MIFRGQIAEISWLSRTTGHLVSPFIAQKDVFYPQDFLKSPVVFHWSQTADTQLLLYFIHSPVPFDGEPHTFYNPRGWKGSGTELTMGKARRKTHTQPLPGTLLPFLGAETMFPRLHPTNTTHESEIEQERRAGAVGGIDELDVVICGSFRKDVVGLRYAFEHLKDLGFNILSPTNVEVVAEEQGFVYMRGEQTQTPEHLELNHLEAIEKSRLVWLHAPEGYVGPTAAWELGFAKASGIPVFSNCQVVDVALRSFVTVVPSPEDVLDQVRSFQLPPPPPGLKAFQHYYRRAAVQRGFEKESSQNCLLLMVEEVGELARALRKKHHLTRHGAPIQSSEALELADVFMYVVHMANILRIDLGQVVQQKELINIDKLLQRA